MGRRFNERGEILNPGDRVYPSQPFDPQRGGSGCRGTLLRNLIIVAVLGVVVWQAYVGVIRPKPVTPTPRPTIEENPTAAEATELPRTTRTPEDEEPTRETSSKSSPTRPPRVTEASDEGTGLWSPCPSTYESQLHIGMNAYVSLDPPEANRIRQSPSTSADLIGTIEPGVNVTIIDGPECNSQWVWWKVRSETGLVGWTSEGDASNYWLIPGTSTVSDNGNDSSGDCPNAPTGTFVSLWRTYQTQLGCPIDISPYAVTAVEQLFQRGHMFWREDIDRFYVVYDEGGATSGRWVLYTPQQVRGFSSCSATPPSGLYEPESGFGLIWCSLGAGNSDIGWGLDRHYAFAASIAAVKVQDFADGVIYQDSDGSQRGKAYIFFDDGSFIRKSN